MTSMQAQPSGSRPLHEKLYEEMLGRIRDGIWAEGDKVPSEQALIDEFGTSRGPIRQALSKLRSEGAVEGGRGAPPRVRRLVPTQSFHTFMSFTDWAHSLGRVPGQRVIEAARRPAQLEHAKALEVAVGDPIIEILRLRLLDNEPAMLERSTFPKEVGKPLLSADLDTGSIYQTMRDNGFAPGRARHVFDAIAADETDSTLLGVDRKFPLLRVRRMSWDADGRLLEWADDRYLPSMANFVIENSSSDRSRLLRRTADDSSPL